VIRLCVLTLCLLGAQVFRSHTEAVTISASVKRGNVPVPNLTAEAFRVTDNGIPQTVELLTVESIPIDVSLFFDSSGSTAGAQGHMRRDAAEIAAMLRPEDRFRVLTIGVSVDESVPWQPAGAPVALDVRPTPGISLIYDALFAAVMHRVETGRRHLVVGLTDGDDCGSVIDGPTLLDAAGRTEAVLHVVYVRPGGSSGLSARSLTAWCTPVDPDGPIHVAKAADRTGGGSHSAMFGGEPAVRAFRKILDDFRASYVLRYSPRGVAAVGWHAIAVDVPSIRDAKIRARSGYFVER
jgi:VWFA-related protein